MPERRYTLAPGPDVDLEREDVRDSKGNRITEDYVRLAVDDVHEKLGRGRPSLTGRAEHSPHVSFRVTAELKDAAERRATREGRRVSDVAREALERYLRDAS